MWDYLFIDDCAAAITAALRSNAEGVFVLGSGRTTTIREVIELIGKKIDPSLPLGFDQVPAGQAVANLQANIERLQGATGWAPSTSLDAGLDLTIQSIRDEQFAEPVTAKAVLHES